MVLRAHESALSPVSGMKKFGMECLLFNESQLRIAGQLAGFKSCMSAQVSTGKGLSDAEGGRVGGRYAEIAGGDRGGLRRTAGRRRESLGTQAGLRGGKSCGSELAGGVSGA